MDRYCFWRFLDCIPNGISIQVRHNYRHCNCISFLMAVSILQISIFTRLTHFLGAVQPSPIFLTLPMANHVSNSSNKLSHFILFAILSLPKIGISPLLVLTLHWLYSPFYTLTSSIARLPCTPWHVFQEQSIQRLVIFLALQ